MNKNKLTTIVLVLCSVFTLCSFTANASMYSKKQARKTIEQTSYIIDEAYEIASFYSYWQTNKVSKAMYYNDYAQTLYFYRSYKKAIRYSLLARQYALDVIDNCDDYWEYFYFTYYGWSFRYGYNYNFAYMNGYRDGYYDAYYARYCYRHQHDYRHDPHRNMHNEWYSDNRYNEVVSGQYFASNSGTSFDRGNTGRIGTSTSSSNSSLTRNTYNNVRTNDYYSETERVMLNDIPSESNLEREFQSKNPTVNFSDEKLDRNSEIVRRNTRNSTTFTSTNKDNTTRNNITLQRPTQINSQDTVKTSSRLQNNSRNNIDRNMNTTNNSTSTMLRNRNTTTDASTSTTTPARTTNQTTRTTTTSPTTRNIQRSTTNTTNNSKINSTTTTRQNNTIRNNNNNSSTTRSNSSSNNSSTTIKRNTSTTTRTTTTPSSSPSTTRQRTR